MKKSIGMTNKPEYRIEIDLKLSLQVLDKQKTYESTKTPGYQVMISEIEDSYVVFYEKGSPDKEAQKLPTQLFKQFYKEVV